jgi:predicted secreted protein
MSSSAFWAYGSKLKLGDGASPEVFTTIAEVKDITPPPMKRETIDVSSQDSTDAWREFIPGWRDGAEVSFNCNWIPKSGTQDQNTGVLSTFADNSRHNWQILLPDATTLLAFAAFVTEFAPDLKLDKLGEISIKLKVSGAVTVTS